MAIAADFVLDASVALSWFLPGEQPAIDLLHRATESSVVVPGLWPLEVANVLLTAERRRRIDSSTRQRILSDYARLPLTVDNETANRAWTDILKLATAHGLSVYDACYLELARRHDLPLATLDGKIAEVGRAIGIEILGR